MSDLEKSCGDSGQVIVPSTLYPVRFASFNRGMRERMQPEENYSSNGFPIRLASFNRRMRKNLESRGFMIPYEKVQPEKREDIEQKRDSLGYLARLGLYINETYRKLFPTKPAY